MNKLIINHITKKYNNNEILKDISLSVKENETVSILGPSGCGKTTLFNLIAGLISPDIGNIYIDKNNITNTTGMVSYMPQKDLLLPYKTILQNVTLPLILNGTSKHDAENKILGYFETFLLTGIENKYPNEISGGMRQRAAFLRTYMYEKDIMLLDEPFSALDPITKNTMYTWYLNIIQKFKKTTLFITHSIDEAILLSDTIYILSSKSHNITNRIDVSSYKNTNSLFTQEFINLKLDITNILNLL